METKQTAVEWLEKELIGKNGFNILKDIFNQAKEIERLKIINSYNDGCIDTLKDEIKIGQQYYNETFNK